MKNLMKDPSGDGMIQIGGTAQIAKPVPDSHSCYKGSKVRGYLGERGEAEG